MHSIQFNQHVKREFTILFLLIHVFLGKRRPTILIFDSLVSRPNHKSHLAELNGFHNETAIQIRAGLFALHKVRYYCQNYVVLSFHLKEKRV